MGRKIAILRGINVGGKRNVLMAELKFICEKLGWTNVQTYIQSGNLIFNSDKPCSELENDLEKMMTDKFEFYVPVIVRTAKELEVCIEKNPFLNNSTIEQLYLTFLKETPTSESVKIIKNYKCNPDQFKIEDKDVFVFCAGKYHQSKLTNNFFEKKLSTEATTRNWKTVVKLIELSKV